MIKCKTLPRLFTDLLQESHSRQLQQPQFRVPEWWTFRDCQCLGFRIWPAWRTDCFGIFRTAWCRLVAANKRENKSVLIVSRRSIENKTNCLLFVAILTPCQQKKASLFNRRWSKNASRHVTRERSNFSRSWREEESKKSTREKRKCEFFTVEEDFFFFSRVTVQSRRLSNLKKKNFFDHTFDLHRILHVQSNKFSIVEITCRCKIGIENRARLLKPHPIKQLCNGSFHNFPMIA